MRKFAALFALVAVSMSPTPAFAHFTDPTAQEFDLGKCAVQVTHVLVVDARGVILDVWEGDARVGDAIPLDTILNRGQQYRSDTPIDFRGFWYDQLPRCDRMILFLRKRYDPPPLPEPPRLFGRTFGPHRPEPDPAEDIAAAALTRVSGEKLPEGSAADVWRLASLCGRPAYSVAVIDDLRGVRTRGASSWDCAGSEEQFRRRVYDALGRRCGLSYW